MSTLLAQLEHRKEAVTWETISARKRTSIDRVAERCVGVMSVSSVRIKVSGPQVCDHPRAYRLTD